MGPLLSAVEDLWRHTCKVVKPLMRWVDGCLPLEIQTALRSRALE